MRDSLSVGIAPPSLRNEKVRGSNPLSSTTRTPSPTCGNGVFLIAGTPLTPRAPRDVFPCVPRPFERTGPARAAEGIDDARPAGTAAYFIKGVSSRYAMVLDAHHTG